MLLIFQASKTTTLNMMVINKAIFKYGYFEFKLEILEYCNPKELVLREQYYMDPLYPKYNVLKTANSSLNYKQTEKTLVKKFAVILKG